MRQEKMFLCKINELQSGDSLRSAVVGWEETFDGIMLATPSPHHQHPKMMENIISIHHQAPSV